MNSGAPRTGTMDTSYRMKRVRRENTDLEMKLRRALWARGVRYRIHPQTIEGRPDIGVASRRIAVFVDGCFWHGCPICRDIPKTHRDFWKSKFRYNRARRLKVRRILHQAGWTVLEIWGHEIEKDLSRVVERVALAFGSPNRKAACRARCGFGSLSSPLGGSPRSRGPF